MANVSGFYQDIFGIYEGNSIDMTSASLRNGKAFHDNNNTVSLPSVLSEQGERIIEKPYTYFILGFHRYDFDFVGEDNREISLWLNGEKKLERIETGDKNTQLYYDEAGQGAFQGYDGLFVIKVKSSLIPYPLKNFNVQLENDDGSNIQTCYYSLENNTAWDKLYMDSFKIIGDNGLKLGQLNYRQKTYNNKLFGGYYNYSAKDDVSNTETQTDQKNIYFFSGNDIYLRGPRVNIFGELMAPGSVCFNNDFSKNYLVRATESFSGETMYCVRISTDGSPSEITSVHVNFQKDGKTFRLEAPNAIQSTNKKIVSIKDYKANIDLKSPFIYRQIITREEESFQLQTTITADIGLNKNLPFNISGAQIVFGSKNGRPVRHNISDWNYSFDFSVTHNFNRDTRKNGFSLPNIVGDDGVAGQGKFYLYATNLFDSKTDYYPISNTYICENKICDNTMYISKHKIVPISNETITIPGFIVLNGEKFIIYDVEKFDLNNLTSTALSGNLFTFTYGDLTKGNTIGNVTTFYDFQKEKNELGYYPYIIQAGRTQNPTLKNYSKENPKRILEAKQNNLFFSFEDNGSDETIEKAGNDFVINRTTNNASFSFSREGTTTKTIKEIERTVTYERLEVTVADLKKESSITFTYYPTYGIGSPQIDATNRAIAVPVLAVINLLQENQTNTFDLSPFKNILPTQGGEAIISLHLYYEKGTYKKDLFKLNDIHFTIRGAGSPFGLRSNGVVINPIEADPEDVEPGYAEKINVLFNNNKATPIQASVRDSSNDILKQCEIQYKGGKWYFNDVDVSDSNNTKAICLSDLTVNADNWKEYVIYTEEYVPNSNTTKTVKDKIYENWYDLNQNIKPQISNLNNTIQLIYQAFDNYTLSLTEKTSSQYDTYVASIAPNSKVTKTGTLTFSDVPTNASTVLNVGIKIIDGNSEKLYADNWSFSYTTSTSGTTHTISYTLTYRERNASNNGCRFQVQAWLAMSTPPSV